MAETQNGVLPPNVEALKTRMQRADWFYDYSDDPSARKKGAEEIQAIYADLATLAQSDFASADLIWNETAPSELSKPDFLNATEKRQGQQQVGETAEQRGHGVAQEMSFAEFVSRSQMHPLENGSAQSMVLLDGESIGIADVPGEAGFRQVHRELVNNALLVNEPGNERFKGRPLPSREALAEYPELLEKFPAAAGKVMAAGEQNVPSVVPALAEAARAMTDVEARSKAADDLRHLRQSIEVGDETERLYMSRDMAVRAAHNVVYAEQLGALDPELERQVREYVKDPAWDVRVNVADNLRRAQQDEEFVGEIGPADLDSVSQTFGVTVPETWTGEIQVQPCVSGIVDGAKHIEPAAPGEAAEFWGVYARLDDGRVEWLKDFNDKSDALNLQQKLENAFADRAVDEIAEASVASSMTRGTSPNASMVAVAEKRPSVAQSQPGRKIPAMAPARGTPLLHRTFVKDAEGNVRRLGEDKVALKDLGKKIRVVDKQRDAFQAAIEIAEEKGWSAIEVRGSGKFKAEAWYHAQLRGLNVKGYEPSAADKERLAQALKRNSHDVADGLVQSAEEAKALALKSGHGLQEANRDVGKYEGKVIAETAHHIVQTVGRNVAVLHEKSALSVAGDKMPDGPVSIAYKDGKGAVKGKELARAGRER